MMFLSDEKTELFIKAYRSFLKSEGEMEIDQFIMLYKDMAPSLHKYASDPTVDSDAFVYALLRLPSCIYKVKKIVLAQTDDIFKKRGFDIHSWEEVTSPSRRRKMYFDNDETLAIFINSVTDVDDIICLLTAYHIEWNKMHELLKNSSTSPTHDILRMSEVAWNKLQKIWKKDFEHMLTIIKSHPFTCTITLLRGSYVEYMKASQRWFENILANTSHDLSNQPLYFISSNTHSIVNIISGWVNGMEDEIIQYLHDKNLEDGLTYWKQIESGTYPGSKENFLWYMLKKFERDNKEFTKKRLVFEKELGIEFIEAEDYLDIDAQIISIKDLAKSSLVEKLHIDATKLAASDGLILNIDYPLGLGAYMVFSTIMKNVNNLKGLFVLGKAAFLNGKLGDIAIPTTIYDTYSDNTYTFKNALTKNDLADFQTGSILSQQKGVSVKGTLLQPKSMIHNMLMANYAIIEMENGPYLSALYESINYERYPRADVIDLMHSPIAIGIVNYASDTPYTSEVTLGTRSLGYEGIEATYISSLAILRYIVRSELER